MHYGHRLGDHRASPQEVEPADSQRRHFAEPHPGIGEEQDHEAMRVVLAFTVAAVLAYLCGLATRVGQRGHLLVREVSPLGCNDAREVDKPRLATVTLADAVSPDVPQLTSAQTLPLWRGYLAVIVGPGESGMSWLAAHAALDVTRHGKDVLVLDGEMSGAAWRRRLLALGANDDELDRVHYAEMSDESASIERVTATIRYLEVALTVWDSALSLICRTARSENDNAEVARVYDRLRAIVHSGSAGLIVDHTAANASTSISRGATAKFNALDLAYGVRLAEGSIPGPLSDWSSIITVEKDRHGLLPSRDDREATFHPLGDTGHGLVLEVAEVVSASHRLSATNPVALAVSRIAGLDPPPKSANDAYKRLSGRRQTIQAAYRQWSGG
jgi:hypothetical protein